MYVTRKLESHLYALFKKRVNQKNSCVVLSGIVGVGKTTLVHQLLSKLKVDLNYKVFEFTGDDSRFRANVAEDTKFIFNEVTSVTSEKALVFIDEVQKQEFIFDAIKYALDRADISFIISGSNPKFLETAAKKRLQRRADFFKLFPFSLAEILEHNKLVPEHLSNIFHEMLFSDINPRDLDLKLSLTPEISEIIDNYVVWGGLPEVTLTDDDTERRMTLMRILERGFEPMLVDADNMSDIIRIELARNHSQEFTYKDIFKKTGMRSRDSVNDVIAELKDHGYLLQKKPLIFDPSFRSYHKVLSYTDIGIVNYLLSRESGDINIGPLVEGYLQTRLTDIFDLRFTKYSLSYYKPYKIYGEQLKFLAGEIDFLYQEGNKIIAMEAKQQLKRPNIRIPLLKSFVEEHELKFGIVFYRGIPFFDEETNILYWPYWGV